ncbi:hypothetical protein AV530_001904 [Patagioenas fasciata monilis]|uniref:Uncharacterized protein n=1 Tax=Patagioenas fasciata monilis TaxID=372326 RepID=A0A1V4J6H7_PATFA|nr:hypothetical protein AV530_001904 [Patagioenas fasciata monilis]
MPDCQLSVVEKQNSIQLFWSHETCSGISFLPQTSGKVKTQRKWDFVQRSRNLVIVELIHSKAAISNTQENPLPNSNHAQTVTI